MVNQYYFYAVDADFGLFFLKYSSYFPYGAKLCFNGHEYLKRQLAKEGIGYRGIGQRHLELRQPGRMRSLADGLTPRRIERVLEQVAETVFLVPSSMDEQASRLPLSKRR